MEDLCQRAEDHTAILANGRPPLTRHGLRVQTRQTADWLAGIGVSANDRVATVLPSGPELATCVLSVAAGATAAPLTHNYQQPEFEFYVDGLSAKAVIVHELLTSLTLLVLDIPQD